MSADPYLGEVMIFAGTRIPIGWAACNGQLLSVTGNVGLFALLGNIYGGDGRTDFALPDMRGYFLTGPTAAHAVGYKDGTADQCAVQLGVGNLPPHNHGATFTGTATTGTTQTSIPIKKRLASGTSEGSVTAVAGSFLGEGPATTTNAAAIYVPGTSTADTVNLAAASGTVSMTAQGNVAVASAGAGQPVNVPIPRLTMQYLICISGLYPTFD